MLGTSWPFLYRESEAQRCPFDWRHLDVRIRCRCHANSNPFIGQKSTGQAQWLDKPKGEQIPSKKERGHYTGRASERS